MAHRQFFKGKKNKKVSLLDYLVAQNKKEKR